MARATSADEGVYRISTMTSDSIKRRARMSRGTNLAHDVTTTDIRDIDGMKVIGVGKTIGIDRRKGAMSTVMTVGSEVVATMIGIQV